MNLPSPYESSGIRLRRFAANVLAALLVVAVAFWLIHGFSFSKAYNEMSCKDGISATAAPCVGPP